MIATTNREPAKLPQKVINQCVSILKGLIRPRMAAIVVNMKLAVQRSDAVITMAVKPQGKVSAAIILISPGAFV